MDRSPANPLSCNRVHVLYDDGAAVFDLPTGATFADLVELLDEAAEGHRTLSVRVSLDSNRLPI
jgi:hypothetical protein